MRQQGSLLCIIAIIKDDEYNDDNDVDLLYDDDDDVDVNDDYACGITFGS